MPLFNAVPSWKSSRRRNSSTSRTNQIHVTKTAADLRSKTSAEDLWEKGYRLGRILGEGSYSKVRAATYFGQEIAVKVITRSELSTDFESQFLPREIEILSKIRHRNIIKVYKILSYPRKIYIVTELIRRGDMVTFIRNRGRLPEPEACHYFRQIVSAVKYLHSQNIAHRDLKCENIMVTEEDEIRLIDFGFCRYTVNEKGRRVLSKTFCGSSAYASPEILQGIPYNPMMNDVWSLGCILFIMVTGTMPFVDSNIKKMVMCQLKREFKYPENFAVGENIKILISRMLEPDVTRRATLNQISRCPWLKRRAEAPPGTEAENIPFQNNPSSTRRNSKTIGTQTDFPDSSDES